MDYNYDALNIIFKIETLENKKERLELLKYSFDYYTSFKDYSIEECLIRGWNAYIMIHERSNRYLSLPSDDFLFKVNHLYKYVRRKKMIDELLS